MQYHSSPKEAYRSLCKQVSLEQHSMLIESLTVCNVTAIFELMHKSSCAGILDLMWFFLHSHTLRTCHHILT